MAPCPSFCVGATFGPTLLPCVPRRCMSGVRPSFVCVFGAHLHGKTQRTLTSSADFSKLCERTLRRTDMVCLCGFGSEMRKNWTRDQWHRLTPPAPNGPSAYVRPPCGEKTPSRGREALGPRKHGMPRSTEGPPARARLGDPRLTTKADATCTTFPRRRRSKVPRMRATDRPRVGLTRRHRARRRRFSPWRSSLCWAAAPGTCGRTDR